VTPPVNNNSSSSSSNTNTCTNPTIGSSTNGTFTLYINGVAYTGNIVSGILYAANGGLNATGSGSGVVSGTVSGSSGGNDGYLLTTPLNLVSGSGSGTAVIDTKTYNISVSTAQSLTITCP
jgi:hypothetical protein